MDRLQENLENLAKAEAEKYGLAVEFAFCDVFPETKNHDESVDKIEAACKALGIPVSYKELPDRGSEDFGYFTKRVPGALFSIANGETYPAVHDSKFDFIDEEMKYATAIFLELAK